MLGALALLALAPAHGVLSAVDEDLQDLVQVQVGGADLVLRDMDGDGDLDLVRVDGTGLSLRLLGEDGRFAEGETARLEWPERRTAWTLEDMDGSGIHRVLLLTDDGRVTPYDLTEEGFQAGPILVEDRTFLPPGVTAMDFARDVDGDGRPDLVLPTKSAHHVHLAREDGYAPPLAIAYDLAVDLSVGDPGDLGAYVGRHVSVPWFRMEDVDGDGTIDLISETRTQVAVHLAGPDGLPGKPSWILDLIGLQAELPSRQGVNLDDLLANIDEDVSWTLRDLDGVAPNDLIVVLGSKFRVYLGGSRTGPREVPDQLLKSSGKVLGWFVRQVRDDALPELQIVRGERISLGRVLRYLILPGKLDFDIYTYTNQRGTFSRRPTQRGRISVAIPRLLALIEEAEGMGQTMVEQLEIPAKRLNWNGEAEANEGVPNDVVDVQGNQVQVFVDCAPEEDRFGQYWTGKPDILGLLEVLILEDLDALGDEGNVTVDLGELIKRDFTPGAALRHGRSRCTPVWSVKVEGLTEASQVVLLPVDLTGSGQDDLVICTLKKTTWTVRALVRGR